MRVQRLRPGKLRRAAIVGAAALALTAVSNSTADASVITQTPMTSPWQVALADLDGPLIIAWTGKDANHTLNVATSTDGVNFSHSIQPFGQGNSISAPALAVFNGKLWMAWTGTDANHTLNLASSSNGTTWSQATQPLGRNNSPDGPALAAFGGRLYYGWKGTDSKGTLNLASSADGTTFTTPEQPGGNTSVNAPALAGFHGELYMAWAGTDSNHTLSLASSTDGVNFSKTVLSAAASNHQPSLTGNVITGALIIDYTAHDDNLAVIAYTGNPAVQPSELVRSIAQAPAVDQTGNYGIVHAWIDNSDFIWVAGCSLGPPPAGQPNLGAPFC